MATTTTTTTISEKAAAAAAHIALFPSGGMGHLIPFLRLAAMLDSRGCTITLITYHPTVSTAESDHLSTFFAIYPHIKRLEFQLLPYNNSGFINTDPFFIQMETVSNSLHLLHPLLSSLSPSLSAIFADITVTAKVTELVSDLSIPVYSAVPTSARFFSFMAYLPQLPQDDYTKCEAIEVPALGAIPMSSIPPPMLNPNHFFAANIITNVSALSKVKGVLINTFTWFESEAIEALRRNGVEHILPIGPHESFETGKGHNIPWLDKQAPGSVVFVSFGSRMALSKDQRTELAAALEKSSCTFLWVLKGSNVDKEDKDEIDELLNVSFLERTKKKGLVIKGWVNQEQILAHPAIGGFVSHCGWNSVMEAARLGVPILAWPLHGDTRVNAEVVEKAGLGLWVRDWGWGETRVIDRNEIADKLIELMSDKNLRAKVKEVKEKAQQAREINGTSESLLRGLIDSLKTKET